jgi:hypothetical protein
MITFLAMLALFCSSIHLTLDCAELLCHEITSNATPSSCFCFIVSESLMLIGGTSPISKMLIYFHVPMTIK